MEYKRDREKRLETKFGKIKQKDNLNILDSHCSRMGLKRN